MKKVISFVLMMLFLCSCSHEQTEDIYILYTNDVASAMNNGVSYAGVKAYKDQLHAEHLYVSLVDAGDYFDGDVALKSHGADIVTVMNAVGYDVVTLGNQEFSVGLDHLKENIGNSQFDYVSCNLLYKGEGKDPLKAVKPYVIKKYGKVRVAFIGVTTPETLTQDKPSCEAITVNGEPVYSFYEHDDGQELYEQVQKIVNKVRNRAEYVIVISHLGSNSVKEGFSSYDLIANTTGIDVVIDAHSHTEISGEAVSNKDGTGVVLTSTGEHLNNLGELILHTDHTYTTTLYPSVYGRNDYVQAIVDGIYASWNE
ncbi:MAG: CapA family protein [Erysipelotrichaceae bacterium]|nr:CapA family protein [Erysipelotrichaceae bacterium]